ncbi:BppU family phage baseplate upper protein [Staphylococcus saprophyticus]|uniref:BppU family phage baseplate upper protein n=1 Tax=Staphylococcus saprophyticus TaxID=29385 RepID=UPI0018896FF9|nr:BppU family phage baseplate upper protein [Staphylococcus saprophyticus]MBF2780652.1 BppU family phage baseplate upper protein [Staphylococcus saprophyticus]
MTNGIDKKALFKLKSEPYLKPISDLGVGFYNLDENTAILRFQLSNEKGPLLVHENNLTAYAYFESSNGSVSDVIELEIEDSFNGIVTITLDKEFLQASTSTKVKGQVYIGVNNVDGNPEYNEVAVFREFTFEVADALINKISSFTKIEYIRMFSQLKERIEQQVRDIEEAIANGADYVAEMKSVLQEGIETLNAIVTDGKSDVQQYIAQAKTDLTKVKDDATEDITTTANNAKTSVQDTASTAVNSINRKTDEATEHVDAKVTEFNQTVEDNGFLTPDKLTEDLTALNWQKYKLTNNDGTLLRLDLNSNLDVLYAANIGSYYATGVPISNASSTAGLLTIEMNIPKNVKFITFRPFNSTQIWLKRFYNTWSEWERVDNTQTDTGWIPYTLINGVEGNTVYKNDIDNGFDCAYRIVKNGDVVRKTLRVNARNLTQGVTFAELPSSFSKNTQVMAVRTPRDLNGGLVEIKPDGKLIFQYYKTIRDWANTDYIYGEYSWME